MTKKNTRAPALSCTALKSHKSNHSEVTSPSCNKVMIGGRNGVHIRGEIGFQKLQKVLGGINEVM